jgi:uncharacterized protein YyaL (SSP411 family)
LWTEEEIRKALTPEYAELAVRLFGVKSEGNYFEAKRKRTGKNILHLIKPIDQLASELQLAIDEVIFRTGRICKMLFKAREKRVHPTKDDKILVDWNGLMIAALAKASSVFTESRYLQAAVKAADFILEKMKDKNGTLYHRYTKDERAIEGFVDDYAFLVWGLVEIYESSFEETYLNAAVELTNTMISRFWDENEGGFFFTAKGANNAMSRRKQVYDGACPSGNSVALLNMLRLSLLTGNMKYGELANQLIKVFSEEVKSSSIVHAFMLVGVDFSVGPIYNIILVGDPEEESLQKMCSVLKSGYSPKKVISLRQPEAGLGYKKIEGKTTAYVCRGQTCIVPTNKPEKIRELLGLT